MPPYDGKLYKKFDVATAYSDRYILIYTFTKYLYKYLYLKLFKNYSVKITS